MHVTIYTAVFIKVRRNPRRRRTMGEARKPGREGVRWAKPVGLGSEMGRER